MGRIEDAAARLLRSLDDRAVGKITDPNMVGNLALFVGLQSQRTPRARAANFDITAARGRFDVREALDHPVILPIVRAALGRDYTPARHYEIIDEMLAGPDFSSDAKADAIGTAIGVWRNHITGYLAQRTWWLVTSDDPLLTCDEPVVLIGWPVQPRHPAPSFSTAVSDRSSSTAAGSTRKVAHATTFRAHSGGDPRSQSGNRLECTRIHLRRTGQRHRRAYDTATPAALRPVDRIQLLGGSASTAWSLGTC
ncbi:DUF4238 domain-containing protein [Nocardia lijiangensis]|uniref:DUF4238 domain-containing protein n=1 Tax=Nocardia lijiangensis TaxID=299618 RepID=UPI003D74DAE0